MWVFLWLPVETECCWKLWLDQTWQPPRLLFSKVSVRNWMLTSPLISVKWRYDQFTTWPSHNSEILSFLKLSLPLSCNLKLILEEEQEGRFGSWKPQTHTFPLWKSLFIKTSLFITLGVSQRLLIDDEQIEKYLMYTFFSTLWENTRSTLDTETQCLDGAGTALFSVDKTRNQPSIYCVLFHTIRSSWLQVRDRMQINWSTGRLIFRLWWLFSPPRSGNKACMIADAAPNVDPSHWNVVKLQRYRLFHKRLPLQTRRWFHQTQLCSVPAAVSNSSGLNIVVLIGSAELPDWKLSDKRRWSEL